jgi:hypothetical protein
MGVSGGVALYDCGHESGALLPRPLSRARAPTGKPKPRATVPSAFAGRSCAASERNGDGLAISTTNYYRE